MLRTRLSILEQENIKLFYPRIEFCTDNGAMIAYAGCQRLLHHRHSASYAIKVLSRWPITEIDLL